jgi:hypothetical protein
MHAVEAEDLPALHTLVASLRRDHAAVTAGLTLPYRSGAVEGQINRIKALKRATYAAPTSTSYANASSSHTEPPGLPAEACPSPPMKPGIKSHSVDT